MSETIEELRQYLDRKLQRTQEYPYKDWTVEQVKNMIFAIKKLLNEIEDEND